MRPSSLPTIVRRFRGEKVREDSGKTVSEIENPDVSSRTPIPEQKGPWEEEKGVYNW